MSRVVGRPVGAGARRAGFRAPAGDVGDSLAALTRVTAELAAAATLDAVIDAAVTHAADALGAAVTTLMLVDGDQVVLAGGHGLQAGVEKEWATFPLDDTTPGGYCARTGEPVIVHDSAEVAQRWPSMAQRVVPGRSLVALPLGAPPDVVGALGMTFDRNWTPGARELAVLAPFADACAQAVRRVAAAEQAELRERQLTFLADASLELASSLDYRKTLSAVADLVVRGLADWCAVHVVDGEELSTLAVAHADPEKVAWAWELQRRFGPPRDAPTGAPAVVRTGASELYEDIPDELLVAGARSEEELELLRALQMRSALVVPLTARGRTLGAITMIRTATGAPRYNHADLIFAEELGRRAALAVDNAHLHSQVRDVALLLQRAVLPEAPPEPPGWDVAAHYEPGGDAEVGGDFYDALPLADGRLAVLVGDVMGHGVPAAAAMAQIRAAIRALITVDPDPSVVLARLQSMFVKLHVTRLVSVVYALADPAAREIQVINAGAMPPVLVAADGTATLVRVPIRPMLGVEGECPGAGAGPTPALSVPLPPGATLLLYTDGLVETRGEVIDDGLTRLVAEAPRLVAGELGGALRDVVGHLRAGVAHDDVTALALRSH